MIEQAGQNQEVRWEEAGRLERGFGQYIIYMDRIHAYLLPDEAVGAEKEKLTALFREALPKERRKRV